MKWISIGAAIIFVLGVAMVREGQVANSMKAENREGLILYGLLICAICVAWFVIHVVTAMVRQVMRMNPSDSAQD